MTEDFNPAPVPSNADNESEASPACNSNYSLITVEDFRTLDFEAPLRDLKCVNQYEIHAAYRAALAQENHEPAQKVFRLLEAITSIRLQPNDKGNGWIAMASGAEWSTAIPAHFHGEQSKVFAEIMETISHPALRARIADVVWTNDRRIGKAGKIAIQAYRECLEELLSGNFSAWRDIDEALLKEVVFQAQRMLQIIDATTKRGKRPEWLEATFKALYDRSLSALDYFSFAEAAELGLHYELLERGCVVNDAEGLAQAAEAGAYPQAVKRVWDLAANLHNRLGDPTAERRCRIGALECTLAMRAQVQGSAGGEAFWVTQALQELRHIDGMEDKERDLEIELRRLQKASMSEMGTFSIEFKIHEEREKIGTLFFESSLPDALRRFVFLSNSRELSDLRAEALETARASPLMAMSGVNHVDSNGRPIDITPGAPIFGDPDQAWFDRMFDQAENLRRHHAIAAKIDPAREAIYARFGIAERHLAPVINFSPFVPAAQKPLLILGFTRFFQGDLMSAAHLVIGQLEPCLRYILQLNGHDPAKRRDDSTEEDLSLSGIYSRFSAQLAGILGEALSDEIDRLFNRHPGPALRHQFAHGQVSAAGCFSPDVYYGIWLIYRVCCLFVLKAWDQAVAPAIEAAQ